MRGGVLGEECGNLGTCLAGECLDGDGLSRAKTATPPSVASEDATRIKRSISWGVGALRHAADRGGSVTYEDWCNQSRLVQLHQSCLLTRACFAAATTVQTRATSPARQAGTTTWTKSAARRAPPAQHGKSSSARTHRKSSQKARQTKTTSTGSVWSAPRSSRDRKSLCASGTGLPAYTRARTHTHTHSEALIQKNCGPLRRYKFCEIDLDQALGPVLDNLERISCHRCARVRCPAITCIRA